MTRLIATVFLQIAAAVVAMASEPVDSGPSDGSILLESYEKSHQRGAPSGEMQATDESFVGDYVAAGRSYGLLPNRPRHIHAAPLQKEFIPVSVTTIVDAAKGKRVVALNEAHILAQTRTVTFQLLPLLREQGFNTLALEALDPTPDDLNQRSYPLETSGTYTREPIFGELIRSAIELGFKVVPYEASSAQGLAPEKREQAQFENLWKVLDADPNARVVVHAGYAHIFKSSNIAGAATMMQRLLKKIPEASVLIVDQTEMVAVSPATGEIDFSAIDNPSGSEPFVLRRPDATFYAAEPERFDISVVFPQATVTAGRPSWLSLNGARSPHSIGSDVCGGVFPCLVEAHYATELEHAVAADRYLFTAPGQEVFMYTRRRPATFSVTNEHGTHGIREPVSLAPYQLPY